MKLYIAAASIALAMASSAHAIVVTTTSDATQLVETILGNGISIVGTPVLTGQPAQFGVFEDGGAQVDFDEGIVLSTGLASGINDGDPDANLLSDGLGGSGTPLIADSNDAAVLEFQFQFDNADNGTAISFEYVFASEEYLEFVGSQFIDEFRLIVDGQDLALVNGSPVNIDNVNDTTNSAFFIDNETLETPTTADLPFAFDGLTTVLTAESTALGLGVITAQLVIADVGDEVLDSAVFIRASTFDAQPGGPIVPVPGALPLMLGGGALLARARGKTAKKIA